MSYTQLTIESRIRIETLLAEGFSQTYIADRLQVNRSTITREIQRVEGSYTAAKAHAHAEQKKSAKGRPTKCNEEMVILLQDRLKRTWFPEQIIGREKKVVSCCVKTVYNWIKRGFLGDVNRYLRRKGKPPKTQEKRGKFLAGQSIHNRPAEIEIRETFGHWEGDTIVSSRGESKACFGTFRERKSRLHIAIPMSNRTKESMLRAVDALIAGVGIECVKSLTVDRGKEFAGFQ